MTAADALTAENRARLLAASVATISTCLYRAGIRQACLTGVGPVAATQPRMAGPAFTLRFVPARDDVGGPASYDARGSLHQRAFEDCPPGAVLVMDTRGELGGCCGGDLLVGRLKARGCAGVVTDGGFRDTPDVAALAFPAFARRPVPAPSFGRLHAVEIGGPIGCADVAVYPGDIVVGDGEGVVVIPAQLANRIAVEAAEQTRYDTFAAAAIAGGRPVVGLYPPTERSMQDYAAWCDPATSS